MKRRLPGPRGMAASSSLADAQMRVPDLVMRRISWLTTLIYMVAIIDKQNVSFAKLQMVHTLNISETAFGAAASLFFVGSLVVEIPSTLLSYKVGVRRWMATLMLLWGGATMAMAAVHSGGAFALLRLLVGSFEAGLYPGIVMYYSLWLPRSYQVRALAFLTLGSALGNMAGSGLGGLLLSLDGVLHVAGWQFVFLVTGGLAVCLAPVILLLLPDRPDSGRFLSKDDSRILLDMIAREKTGQIVHTHGYLGVVFNPKILAIAFFYTSVATALIAVIYWTPTLFKTHGMSDLRNGYVSMLPWLLTAIVLMVVPRLLRTDSRTTFAAMTAGFLGAACFGVSAVSSHPVIVVAATVIGTPCISLLFPCILSLPSRYFDGYKAAAAIASLCIYGSSGGIIAQVAMPLFARVLGNPGAAMLFPASCLGIVGAGALTLHLVRTTRVPEHAKATAP